jgi:hypothetical protein
MNKVMISTAYPNVHIYELIESKLNEIILTINHTYTILEAGQIA